MTHDIETNSLKLVPSDFARGRFLKSWSTGRTIAFIAAVSGEEKYIKWAREWALALTDASTDKDDDHSRGRLQCLAIAYDWLFNYLSADEKVRLQDAIIAMVEKNWYFVKEVDFVSGHSRWGCSAIMMGLLSAITERPELQEKLMTVRANWINGFFPVQSWIAKDGGYHMGWAYSSAYLTGDIYAVWSSATNECVYFPWRGKLPQYWIYGTQGDGNYPYTGDAYTQNMSDRDIIEIMVINAGVFKNPYAQNLIPDRADRIMDILYGDKDVKPLAPDNPSAPLPLSKYFSNAGVVIARDSWDAKTTMMQFRSVPFYSANHHHRDENSFTLHYKGALAIDAGTYDGYGSVHWNNYFTRTVAHNAITVFDPKQEMTVYNIPASNDGGQIYKDWHYEPSRFKDILPGGGCHLDGISQFRDTKDYTYAAGNATKAYDGERVKLAEREIVYLRKTSRPHPVVVIFDRIESTKPEFKKSFILHAVYEPKIEGNTTVIENNGGRLTCVTMVPENAELQLIGGLGKDAWVNGVNYPSSRGKINPVATGDVHGSWRLEVSPKNQQTTDYFLNVLFVDDTDAAPVKPDLVKLNKDGKSYSVEVAGWSVQFPLKAGGIATIKKNKR